MTHEYNILAETNKNSLMTEYTEADKRAREYQTEAQLETWFINRLQAQGYEYLKIHTESDLIANLRTQLERLNNYRFTDNEWHRFFSDTLARPNYHVCEKTKMIQDADRLAFRKDDGTTKNIILLNKATPTSNKLQVINQYETDAHKKNRYDVTILVNGLPLVHTELKRRGVRIKEAFNQIERYQRDSFWSGSGLFEYVQIFVISNGTSTKYYSNTVREQAARKGNANSFEFTSYWSTAQNERAEDLVDFTREFFEANTLLEILTKYCIFTTESTLMAMRPYQIEAAKKIIEKINLAHTYKKYGTRNAGGYIWHATGSGKTLTSFKTAQLALKTDGIKKVIFIVDRKDLDYQTMKEYDKFQKGAANGNTSTSMLEKQLNDDSCQLIITTVQKLSNLIKKSISYKIYNEEVVLIFDECHRSQFGAMHDSITKTFKKYYIFGFTGTPIFACNAQQKTTEDVFGACLHKYTTLDAVIDKSVLPYRIDYVQTVNSTVKIIKDEEAYKIDESSVYNSPERISLVTRYILEHFDQKTYRTGGKYLTDAAGRGTNGYLAEIEKTKARQRSTEFNSIFAVASIAMAKAYYAEFKKQMEKSPELKIKVGLIYSYAPNSDAGSVAEENSDSAEGLEKPDKDFLESAMEDYNKMFGTSYDTSKLEEYYKNVSEKMKNRELDLLIVVNMFLTGFDSKTLNTLWVDKYLNYHGLIQAFSRTNRICNAKKDYGNIICFRNLQREVNAALSLFADKEAGGVILAKSFAEYYNGYNNKKGEHIDGYKEIVHELQRRFKPGSYGWGEAKTKGFIVIFGKFLRAKNLLSSFDEFAGKEILSEREMQNYQSKYLDIKDEMREKEHAGINITDDIVFETDLVRQTVGIDQSLMLIKMYHQKNCQDKELLLSINSMTGADPILRKKKDLINEFVYKVNDVTKIEDEWDTFVCRHRKEDLDRIIKEENLDGAETRKLMEKAFRAGVLSEYGTDIDKIFLQKKSFFGNSEREETKQRAVKKLQDFINKYNDIEISKFVA